MLLSIPHGFAKRRTIGSHSLQQRSSDDANKATERLHPCFTPNLVPPRGGGAVWTDRHHRLLGSFFSCLGGEKILPGGFGKAADRRRRQTTRRRVASEMAPVPETVLKKRRKDEGWRENRSNSVQQAKKKNAEKGKKTFHRAEEFVREFVKQERDHKRLKREVKGSGKKYVEPDAKVVFAVRIRGIDGVHPKTRKILQLLRLRHINCGVFLKVSKPVMHMLRMVEPYVAYGYPNLKTVKDLVYKRGHGRVEKQRVALTDNELIEKALGEYDIICIEDLVHEIHTAGSHFKEVNNFLWPFKLSPPKNSLSRKNKHLVDAGEAGNREDKINELIARMT